jgi:hypothetical protein
MPYDDPDETDPMELCATALPPEPGGMHRMAEAIIDEYVRIGFDEERIVDLFRDPFFAMTHSIWRELGEVNCRNLVHDVVSRWRRV